MARLPYVDPSTATGEMAAIFKQLIAEREPDYVPNLYRLLANSPDFMRGWMTMGTASRRSELDARLRELAILEVGRLCKANYEWVHHSQVARSVGVTPEQIEAVREGGQDGLFDDRERAVLAYARAMTADVRVPDEVFEAVRRFFDDKTLLDLSITIAFYNMVCRILLAMQIDLEPGEPAGPWE